MAAKNSLWANHAKRHVKMELSRADVGYAELAARLAALGVTETEGSIAVKISRGTFPAWFFLAVMRAIGAESIQLGD